MKTGHSFKIGALLTTAVLVLAFFTSCLSARPDSPAGTETGTPASAASETEAPAPADAEAKSSTSSAPETEAPDSPATENKAFSSATAESGMPAEKETDEALQDRTFILNEAGPGKDARPFHTDVASAKNTVLMLYMIGSNLESERGAATKDLEEIAAAEYGEHLKIVLQAGGAKHWALQDIRGTDPGRYELRNGKIEFLESAGSVSMTDRKTLADFLTFTRKNYPADRYILVFWDHGGGTRNGFGLDEVRRRSALTLKDIADTLKKSGMKFDIIGFDACLMATLETACILEPCADFLLASEEYEPSEGWYYTDAVSALAKDPALPSVDFGTMVISGYLEKSERADITLSMLDLRGVLALRDALSDYLAGITGEIRADGSRFRDLSFIRSRTKEFCDGEIDQIDLADFLFRNFFEDGKKEVLSAMDRVIRVFGKGNLPGSYGIAMYFPYHKINQYAGIRRMLNNSGFQKEVESYDYLLSIMSGGQAKGSSGGLFGKQKQSRETSGSSSGSDPWADPDIVRNYEYFIVPEDLPLTESGDGYDLVQPPEFWDHITDIQLQCHMVNDDLTEFVDLGTDYLWETTEEGNRHFAFPEVWMSLDGQIVCYRSDRLYYKEDGSGYVYNGRIPVRLNGEHMAELVVRCDPKDKEADALAGEIQGVRLRDEASGTVERGVRPLSPGDVLELVYDVAVFDTDETFHTETRIMGEPILVTETHQPELGYSPLEDHWYAFFGVLYDIYQRYMETEPFFLDPTENVLYR